MSEFFLSASLFMSLSINFELLGNEIEPSKRLSYAILLLYTLGIWVTVISKEKFSRQIFMKTFSWDALREHQFGAVKYTHIGGRKERKSKKIKRKFELTDSEVCLIFLIKFIHYVLTLDYKKKYWPVCQSHFFKYVSYIFHIMLASWSIYLRFMRKHLR